MHTFAYLHDVQIYYLNERLLTLKIIQNLLWNDIYKSTHNDFLRTILSLGRGSDVTYLANFLTDIYVANYNWKPEHYRLDSEQETFFCSGDDQHTRAFKLRLSPLLKCTKV